MADTGASPYPTAGAGQAGVGAGPVPLTEGCRPRDPGLAMAVGGTPGERPGPARGAEVCTFTWAMLYSWNQTSVNDFNVFFRNTLIIAKCRHIILKIPVLGKIFDRKKINIHTRTQAYIIPHQHNLKMFTVIWQISVGKAWRTDFKLSSPRPISHSDPLAANAPRQWTFIWRSFAHVTAAKLPGKRRESCDSSLNKTMGTQSHFIWG